MNTIKVTIENIEELSKTMESKNSEFNLAYQKIISMVDNTTTFWNGAEQSSYVMQLKEFESELNQLNILLSDYAMYLRKSASSYRLTQDELVNASKRLKIY